MWLVGPALHAAPISVSIDDAIRSAWQRTVEGRQAEAERVRARAGQHAALSLTPEPLALEFSQYSGRWYGDDAASRETEIGLALPLWMPGQRRQARRAADSDLAWAEANAEVTWLELARRVREAAWNATELRGMRELAAQHLHNLELVAGDVRRRVQAGELAETDAMVADSERLGAQVELEQVQRDARDALAQWQSLTGQDAVVEPLSPQKATAAESDSSRHPAVLRARYQTERARERLTLVRQSRRAPPELTVGVKEERAFETGADNERSLGVGLRVPLGSRALDAPQIADAENALALAEAAHRLALEGQNREIVLARQGEAAAARQVESAQSATELLHRRAELLRSSFQAGEIALVELLRALGQAAQSDRALLRQRAAYGVASARLLQAYGTLP